MWKGISFFFLALFLLILVYPLFGILRQSVISGEGQFTFAEFQKFFSQPYYTKTIINSLTVSIAITLATLLIGVPFAYFYSFYQLKGAKFLFVIAILCTMSAPFIGAYSWIMLLGRSGLITKFIRDAFGIRIGSIYGFNGILLVQALKLFPLVFIYMNGVFKNIDSTLLEAAENMGCTGIKRFFKVIIQLAMPTILAASLLVFMRAFADFGTPLLIGEGYRTFPVEIYNQYLGENGTNYSFASAISVIAILVTTAIFFLQKWITKRYNFPISALHPVTKKTPKGIRGVLMYVYCYALIAIAFLPQLYIVYLSFRNMDGAVIKDGFSLGNFEMASKRLLGRSVSNTLIFGAVALIIIILFAILISYLVVRRSNPLNNGIDTLAMIPYIMPGSVIGIALVIAFGKQPFALTGTAAIMIMALVIRRMPYTIRSATATLQNIPISTEEAAISLGASKLKTFARVTVPMMGNGIISGAVLSWVAIVTELSSAIILYNNRNITMTMSAYVAISRGNYGLAAAFSTLLTALTTVSLIVYLWLSKSEDIKL
ncbi:MAG: iron ABC transporter permease [Eubacteriales bacterium]|jgi:iron(III) transport system permease protein|nr:iron ABC transporter permease [Eubacteriales bacterium]MDD4105482.1 iron ABC transporter permease [Eubacteriales bacterium]MDD4710477.1 iron ABC transporter permease [Eubacteriales bacterium]NLO15172.1 iron ABC transporter permease [Clostridiales bacterium]